MYVCYKILGMCRCTEENGALLSQVGTKITQPRKVVLDMKISKVRTLFLPKS